MATDTSSGDFPTVVKAMARAARSFYKRGWMLGTSGNLSAVLSRDPIRMAITASGLHKGELQDSDFLIVDESGSVLSGAGRPSAETLLHSAIAQATDAGAVFHTHSVWATILSETQWLEGGVELDGYEMLKGLAGVVTHEQREWIPIIENSQDYRLLSGEISGLLASNAAIHGILLRRHGLYTWGRDISEARRHVEILEFLFEVAGRRRSNETR